MKFDLIIANPPYGYASNVSIAISKNLMKCTDNLIVLAPLKTFKNKCIKNFVKKLSIVERANEAFSGVQVSHICVAHITKNEYSDRDLYKDFILNKKQLQYQEAIDLYNQSHKTSYTVQSDVICEKNYKDCYLKYFDRIFLITWRCEGNGVHSINSNAKDVRHNIFNEKAPMIGGSASALIFENKRSRDNFAKWWYSSVGTGLTDWILSYLKALQAGGGRMKFYLENFPHLNWNKFWTDQEILEELNLPSNFLEN